jgi:heme-degrading monooxygenase HmoA
VSDGFREGQILTVFRSRLRPDADPAYTEHAEQISDLATKMPGHVDHKTFTAEDGERVTVVTFDDRATHDAWKVQADHAIAQRAGIASYYESYSIQVATVTRATGFRRPG